MGVGDLNGLESIKEMEYISIDKEAIPYQFEMTLAGETFKMQINHNSKADILTLDLYKHNEPIVLGEKLVYGKPLFDNSQHLPVPKVMIIPYDPNQQQERVTKANIDEEVFLFLVGDEYGTMD